MIILHFLFLVMVVPDYNMIILHMDLILGKGGHCLDYDHFLYLLFFGNGGHCFG